MVADRQDVMGEPKTTIPSTCVKTWYPKWTPHCRLQPRTDDQAVSQVPLITHTQPTLSQWKQSQITLTERPWQKF